MLHSMTQLGEHSDAHQQNTQFTANKKVLSGTNLFGKILQSVGCDPLNSKVGVMLMLHKKPRAMTTSDVST